MDMSFGSYDYDSDRLECEERMKEDIRTTLEMIDNIFGYEANTIDAPEEQHTIGIQCNTIRDNFTLPSNKDQKWFRANCLDI